jgi:hypothetical protein
MILVQEAVINKLLNDPNVKMAIGVSQSATGRIREEQGFNAKKMSYPCVSVGLGPDTPMNAQQIGGALAGKQNHRVFVDVHVFDAPDTSSGQGMTSKRLGNIGQKIRESLEGARFDYPGIRVCYCEMESVVIQERDPETGIWHQLTRYALIARVI